MPCGVSDGVFVTGGVDGAVVDDDGFVFAHSSYRSLGTEAHHLGIVGCGDVCFAPQQIPAKRPDGLSVGENGLLPASLEMIVR